MIPMESTALVDITSVHVEKDKPKDERILDYVRKLKDPYHYQCGKYAVSARYTPDGPTIEECLYGLFN